MAAALPRPPHWLGDRAPAPSGRAGGAAPGGAGAERARVESSAWGERGRQPGKAVCLLLPLHPGPLWAAVVSIIDPHTDTAFAEHPEARGTDRSRYDCSKAPFSPSDRLYLKHSDQLLAVRGMGCPPLALLFALCSPCTRNAVGCLVSQNISVTYWSHLRLAAAPECARLSVLQGVGEAAVAPRDSGWALPSEQSVGPARSGLLHPSEGSQRLFEVTSLGGPHRLLHAVNPKLQMTRKIHVEGLVLVCLVTFVSSLTHLFYQLLPKARQQARWFTL